MGTRESGVGSVGWAGKPLATHRGHRLPGVLLCTVGPMVLTTWGHCEQSWRGRGSSETETLGMVPSLPHAWAHLCCLLCTELPDAALWQTLGPSASCF